MDSLSKPLQAVTGATKINDWKNEIKIKSNEGTIKENSLPQDDWNFVDDVEEINLDCETDKRLSVQRSAAHSTETFDEYELHRDKDRNSSRSRDRGGDRDMSSERGSDTDKSYERDVSSILPEFAPVAEAISLRWSENDILIHIANEKLKQKNLDTNSSLQSDLKKNLGSDSKSKSILSERYQKSNSALDKVADFSGIISKSNEEKEVEKEIEKKEEKMEKVIKENKIPVGNVKINKLSQFMKNNSNNSSSSFNSLPSDSDCNSNSDFYSDREDVRHEPVKKQLEIVQHNKEKNVIDKKDDKIREDHGSKIPLESFTLSTSAYSKFLTANSANSKVNASTVLGDKDQEKDQDQDRGSGSGSWSGRLDENIGIAGNGKGKTLKENQRPNQDDHDFFNRPMSTSVNAPLSTKLPLDSMSSNQSTQNRPPQGGTRSPQGGTRSPQHREKSPVPSSSAGSGSSSKLSRGNSSNVGNERNERNYRKNVEKDGDGKADHGLMMMDNDFYESSFDSSHELDDQIDTSTSVTLDLNSPLSSSLTAPPPLTPSLTPFRGQNTKEDSSDNLKQIVTGKKGTNQMAVAQSDSKNDVNNGYDDEYDDTNDSIENWDNPEKSSGNNLQFTIRDSADRTTGETGPRSRSNSRNEEDDDVLYGTTRVGGTKTLYNDFDDTQAFQPDRSKIPDNKFRLDTRPSYLDTNTNIMIAGCNNNQYDRTNDKISNKNKLSVETMTMDSLEGKNFKLLSEDNDHDLVYTSPHSDSADSDSNSNSLNFNLSQSSVNFEMLKVSTLNIAAAASRKLSNDEKKFDIKPIIEQSIVDNNNSKSSLQWQSGRAPTELIETGKAFDVFVSALKLHDDSYVSVSEHISLLNVFLLFSRRLLIFFS